MKITDLKVGKYYKLTYPFYYDKANLVFFMKIYKEIEIEDKLARFHIQGIKYKNNKLTNIYQKDDRIFLHVKVRGRGIKEIPEMEFDMEYKLAIL